MKKSVLFLCTENSARSQIAEAILNKHYSDKFIAYSAGTHPAEQINPFAVKAMSKIGIDLTDKQPKSADIFADNDFDFIITLCDKSKEHCPSFGSKPIYAHWVLPDPADFTGDEKEIAQKFKEILRMLTVRIDFLANLPIDKLDRLTLTQQTAEIGTKI